MLVRLFLLILIVFGPGSYLAALDTTDERQPVGGGQVPDNWADKCRVSGTAHHDSAIKARIDISTGSIKVESIPLNVVNERKSDNTCCYASWGTTVSSSCQRLQVDIVAAENLSDSGTMDPPKEIYSDDPSFPKAFSNCVCVDKETGKVTRFTSLGGRYKVLGSNCQCVRVTGDKITKHGSITEKVVGERSIGTKETTYSMSGKGLSTRPEPILRYRVKKGHKFEGYIFGAGRVLLTVYRTREENGKGARDKIYSKIYDLPLSGDTINFKFSVKPRTQDWRGFVAVAKNVSKGKS